MHREKTIPLARFTTKRSLLIDNLNNFLSHLAEIKFASKAASHLTNIIFPVYFTSKIDKRDSMMKNKIIK